VLGKSKIKGREYSQSMSPNSLAFDLAVAIAVAIAIAVDFTQHERGRCGRRVCGGLVCLTGVYENMDVFIKRAMDGLANSRRFRRSVPRQVNQFTVQSFSTYPSDTPFFFS